MSYTYTTLKTALAEYVEDDFADFTRDLEKIITFAESRVYLDCGLELADLEKTATFNTSTGVFSFDDDHISLAAVKLSGGSRPEKYLSLRSRSYMRMVMENQAAVDNVRYYGPTEPLDADGLHTLQYILGPLTSAGATGTVSAVLHVVPETLVERTAGTYLSINMPDLLFACCLIEIERRNKNPEAQVKREEEYQRAVMEWSGMSNPQRKRDGHNAQQGIGQ